MPELAEVKIMSDFINQHSDKKFTKIVFTKYSQKDKTKNEPKRYTSWEYFQVSSESKGKELKINFRAFNHINNPNRFYHPTEGLFHFLISLGMTGNFIYTDNIPKATRFYLQDENDNYLCFTDTRKFATINDLVFRSWSTNRGPDPTYEYQQFKQKILDNIEKPIFRYKPLYEILMDQRFFNGIGNYLRAEILGRLIFDPRKSLLDLFRNNQLDKLLELCREIPLEALKLGGGQLKDWHNPNYIDKTNFNDWLNFYGKKNKCIALIDSSGRKFWIDRKWYSGRIHNTITSWDFLIKEYEEKKKKNPKYGEIDHPY